MAICAGPTCTLNAVQESLSTATERNILARQVPRRSIGLPAIGLKRHRLCCRRDQPRSAAMSRASGGWPTAPSSICELLQLKEGFKKSLSMSGEVGSLAGDRVVSHERFRLVDLPRRQVLWPPHVGPYPSDWRGCVSWYALLADDHCCRNAVTARNVNSIDAEPGNQLLPRRVRSLGCHAP
jgi:hypothetical protein